MAIIFWLSFFLVFYTYFGYPIIIAIFSYFIKPRVVQSDEVPAATIIIAAYNEELVIAEKIENCLQLDYPKEKLQIIVAADGSDDRTVEIVNAYRNQGVRLSYSEERRGKMAAINRAVAQVTNDIIVFSDANNFYEPQAIKELVAPFGDKKVGAVTGAKLIIQDGRDLSAAEGLYWKYESLIKRNETKIGTCTSAVGEMLAVRRSLFIPPPEQIINDDHYIVLELIKRGYQVVYVETARSFEHVSLTAKDELTRRARMNAGLFQTIGLSNKLLPFNNPVVVWQIISHKFLRPLIPLAMISAFIANLSLVLWPTDIAQNPFLAIAPPYNIIFFLMQCFVYIVALLGNVIKFKGRIGKVLYLFSFLVNSNRAALAGFFNLISGKQSQGWVRVQRGH